MPPQFEQAVGAIYVLPDMPWSRRVSGVFGNYLASASPQRAHAVLTWHAGGGRKGAAGINQLPEDQLGRFVALFDTTFSSTSRV